MKAFITRNKSRLIAVAAAAFWAAVWQLASVAIGEELFLASPLAVIRKLLSLLGQGSFYLSLVGSFWRISLGFLSAFACGLALAAASYRFKTVRALFMPLASVIKATPVASFAILAIILFGSENLSIIISFLMVLPVIYVNTLSGLENADGGLKEMAQVYSLSAGRRARYIYLPAAVPFINSGAALSLGLCWKSGVAAEVIGISANSLGKKLYESKLYYDTAELFAYTLVIILISVIFEKAALRLLDAINKRLAGARE